MSAGERFLILRLDRIGDVVLSTPVLRVLRQAFPHAHLAMMVRPVCRGLVEGHPDLNEVLLYDRDEQHRGWWATVQFAQALRARQFDTALILHPSNRSHVIPWLAEIPRRVGYNRKAGWLLTQQVPHLKHLGTRHESDYTLDVVRALGMAVDRVPPPSVAQPREARVAVARWLAARGVGPSDFLIALHPSASDDAKRWPADRFAQLGDRLHGDTRLRVIVVGGPEETSHAREVIRQMQTGPLDACGQLSLAELAALFERCRVLISNDSGPVHIAAAVGTSVVALFGRNQPGLGPVRWAPVGLRHVVLHKDKQAGGGRVCTNPQCAREFLDITTLTVDEVAVAARGLLTTPTPGGWIQAFPPA